jgi:hypothetical protein
VVGNPTVGELEFPVYGGLTVSESAFLSTQSSAETAFSHTSALAVYMAKEEKIQPLEAHNFVAKMITAAVGADHSFTRDELQWQVKYMNQLQDVAMAVATISINNMAALVTTLIRHRLPGMEEWSIADTKGLPQELVDEVYRFAISEQQKGQEFDEEEVKRDLVESLGKSQKAPTKSRKGSTGVKSSTSSASSTPATRNSRRKSSAPSSATTPSTASPTD